MAGYALQPGEVPPSPCARCDHPTHGGALDERLILGKQDYHLDGQRRDLREDRAGKRARRPPNEAESPCTPRPQRPVSTSDIPQEGCRGRARPRSSTLGPVSARSLAVG